MKLKSLLALVVGAAFAVGASADTWYADASKDAGTGDGTSPETAFHTIQEAIDAAAADDTIYVAEGVYSDGTTNGIWTTTHGKDPVVPVDQRIRVYVTKRLNIIATGAKERTVILGDQGTTSSDKDTHKNPYYRLDCVSCVVIANNVTGVRIEGFTIQDGFAHQSVGSDSLASGGICCYNTKSQKTFRDAFTAVNCDIIGCYGRGAGGMNGGTAIRCMFKGCLTSYRAASAYACRLFNCFSVDACVSPTTGITSSSSPDFVSCLVVNCTTFNNNGRFGLSCETNNAAIAGFGTAYNTLCFANATRYQDSGNCQQSPGTAHNVVCDLDRAAQKDKKPRSTNEVDFVEGSTGVTYLDRNNTADMTCACVCPATRDLRPVKDGCLDGKGDLELVTALGFIPAEELALDFYGRPYDGELPIGVILPSCEVQSGVMKLSSAFRVNGIDQCSTPTYVQTEVWPSQVSLRGSSRRSTDLVLGIQGPFRIYKGIYDEVVQTIPPKANADGTPYTFPAVSLIEYVNDYYVGNDEGQDNASDSNAGTADAPFKTISAAIAAIPLQKDAKGNDYYPSTVIHVRPGTYSIANGEAGGYWMANGVATGVRGAVCVPAKRTVLIRAEKGPDVTFIEGQPDPDTLQAEVLPGCGPKAVRCVMLDISADAAIAGFTLRNGYSSTSDHSTEAGHVTVESYGCAVLTGGLSQHVYDCRITACHGSFAAYKGLYFRCSFTGNTDCLEGIAYGDAYFSSCIFADNCPTAGRILCISCWSCNCSFSDRTCAAACYAQHNSYWMANAAIDTTGTMKNFDSGKPVIGSVIHVATDQLTRFPAIHENPFFAAPWNGDYRLQAPSKAIGAGVAYDPNGKIDTTNLMRYLRDDIFHQPLVAADGSVNAGAVAEVCPAYDTYVDAENGDDANDGLSEAMAKKTLQAVVDMRVPANCRAIALPGVYKEGARVHVGKSYSNGKGLDQPTVRSRVVVPTEKTLISRDGPEVTIIEGEPDPESTDEFGRGPKAVRGAFLEKDAVLSGFTVRYGRCDLRRTTGADAHDTLYQDDLFAGGVLGRSLNKDKLNGATVENCILAENYSHNGAAGCLVTFRDCIVTNNLATDYGNFFRHGEAFNCYVAHNRGPRICDCTFNLVNCTFEENTGTNGTTATSMVSNAERDGKFWNLVNISAKVNENVWLGHAKNFVVAKGTVVTAEKENTTTHIMEYGTVENINTNFTYSELKEMFANGRPVALTAPTVDTGWAEAGDLLPATDVAGNPRVQNGTIDIGAFEADWRGAYAATLGRRVTVTEASPSVVMTDGHPLMQDGTALAATIAARSSATEGDYVVRAALTGSGKMLVYLNGALLGELTASGELRFTNDRETNDLRFEYAGEGSAYVAKVAQELGALLIVR